MWSSWVGLADLIVGHRRLSAAPAPGVYAGRPGIAPDEAEFGGRIVACVRLAAHARQRADPQRGRARELRGEELRVAGKELAVSLDVADDPAARNPVRPVAADRDRHLGGFGELAVRAADRGTEVAERVPALDEDEDPGSIVAEANIR